MTLTANRYIVREEAILRGEPIIAKRLFLLLNHVAAEEIVDQIYYI
ncbi:MAG TPA: hypothetical protein VFC78_14460 [Tepidisphaeraceae bacterium]|nr:hypothetical protein [Tepidisphaeraceae bacterium]